MKRLQQTLDSISIRYQQSLRAEIMTHVVLGYPTLEKSIEIVRAMDQAGARIIELQIPFSDPIADGPVIMEANQIALEQGITPRDCLEAMRTLSSQVSAPLLFMTYFNIPFSFGGGLCSFIEQAAQAGATGLIIPDLPPEESDFGVLLKLSQEHGLFVVPLVSPLSSPERLKKIALASLPQGFVYCVSTTGTTGVRRSLPDNLAQYTATVRQSFNRPLALGFGLSTAEQVQEAGKFVEIAVVGSATIKVIRDSLPGSESSTVSAFIKSLRE